MVEESSTSAFSEIWSAIANQACRRRYPAKVEIFEQTSPANAVYLIERGLVKLARIDSEGRHTTLALRGPGSLLASHAAILARPHVYTAVTVTTVVIHELRSATFLDLLGRDVTVSGFVHKLHSREIDDLLLRMTDLCTVRARRRLERLLWQMSQGLDLVATPEISLAFNELADAIGITAVHLSRVLHELEVDGVIRRWHRHLFITNRDRL